MSINTLHKGDDDDDDNNNNNNKPHIIIRDNEEGTCMLINVTIPGGRNVIKKETDKILTYKDITAEIQRVWNVKVKVIPVTVGRLGLFQCH